MKLKFAAAGSLVGVVIGIIVSIIFSYRLVNFITRLNKVTYVQVPGADTSGWNIRYGSYNQPLIIPPFLGGVIGAGIGLVVGLIRGNSIKRSK